MTALLSSSEPAATVKDFAGVPLYLTSLIGVQLIKWTAHEPPSRRIMIQLCFPCAFLTYNFFSMALFFINDRLETAVEYTELVMYSSFFINALIKGATMWFGRHELELIVKGMTAMHPKTPEQRQAYRLVTYYKKITSYNKFLTMWHMCTTTMVSLQPMATSIVEYLEREDETQEFICRFPFNMWYLYDETRPALYLFSYLIQFCGSYYTSFLFLSGDILLITLVHIVNMHFDYLGRYIEKFEPTGTDEDLKVLGNLLSYHSELLDYAKRIDSTFSLSLLLNYICSTLVLCIIGLQLVLGSDFVSLVKFVAFLIATMVQLYFISYFGHNLIDLSFGISHAFYSHAWYNANNKYMHMLVLPIARAQRYAHLTAFAFFEISMDSFKLLCKTSYQIFTLLRTSLVEEAG